MRTTRWVGAIVSTMVLLSIAARAVGFSQGRARERDDHGTGSVRT